MSGYEGEGTGIDFDLGPTDDYTGTYPSGGPPDYSGDLDTGGGYAPGDPRAVGGGGGGLNIGKTLSDMARGMGLTNKDGSPNWMALLSLLAAGGGAAYGINRTNKANDQYQSAIKDANAQITGLLGGSQAAYDPYKQAGLQGLQRLQNAPQSNIAAGFAPLADRYKPLGTGAAMRSGLSLGNLARGQ